MLANDQLKPTISSPKGVPSMHATEREKLILSLMYPKGFVSFQELDRSLDASPATLRRDLDRMESGGLIQRVRGGAKLVGDGMSAASEQAHLGGVPFHENINLHQAEKRLIGRAAAALCKKGETIVIDGGSTTLQMCAYLSDKNLHVLTNSLHIVSALLGQPKTQISMPSGTVFREQNIVLSPYDDDGLSNYQASKLFIGAAGVSKHGLSQNDVLLIQAERRFFDRADEIVVMVDSSKFDAPVSHILCSLDSVTTLVTDAGLRDSDAAMLEAAGATIVIADT